MTNTSAPLATASATSRPAIGAADRSWLRGTGFHSPPRTRGEAQRIRRSDTGLHQRRIQVMTGESTIAIVNNSPRTWRKVNIRQATAEVPPK
jgi:hypothetical protein